MPEQEAVEGMATHVQGPLYYERMGRVGPVIAFIHPNPMDQSCWMYQMAHLSTWYRCIAIDIPGYGRSPKADPGLTLSDLADACWEAIETEFPEEPAIIVGCSVGSQIAPQMYHRRPLRSLALVLSGTGYFRDGDEYIYDIRAAHKRNFQELGLDYRWHYTFKDLSPGFRATAMAHFFADIFCERNEFGDAATIELQIDALQQPKGESFYRDIAIPTLVLTGTEDRIHQQAFALKEQIAGCQLRVLPGAGHACQLEQPWLFNRFVLEFLAENDLLPSSPRPRGISGPA